MNMLYHGSCVQGLKEINPKESKEVYATPEIAFALLFSVPVRNNLVASWGRLKDGTPYFCEKKMGIFDLFYKSKQSSIYLLEDKNFFRKENHWKEEYISVLSEKVIEEIKVNDVKEYLLDLQRQGKFKVISYEDRKEYFPSIDENVVRDAIRMIDKYGFEKTLEVIKKWRPDVLEEVELQLEKQK